MNEGNRDGPKSLHRSTDESTDQTGNDLKSISLLVQWQVCLSQTHIESLFMHRYVYMFLFEIPSCMALLTFRPSAASEG